MAWNENIAGIFAGIAGDPGLVPRLALARQQQQLKMQLWLEGLKQEREKMQMAKEKNAAETAHLNAITKGLEFVQKYNNMPFSDVMEPVTETVPAPKPGEGQGMFPEGATVERPTGKYRINWTKPGMTLGKAKEFAAVQNALSKDEGSYTLGPGSERRDRAGNVIAKNTELTPWQNIQALFENKKLENQIQQTNENQAQRKEEATARREDKEADREQRRLDAEANRALREQMHADNMAFKEVMLKITTDLKQRLPANETKKLSEEAEVIKEYGDLFNSFNDSYGGYLVGGTWATKFHERSGTKKPQVDWWKTFKKLDSKIRHELYGSQLTPTEKANWDSVTVNENSDSSVIKTELAKRINIARDALTRKISDFEASGYKPGVTVPGSTGKKDVAGRVRELMGSGMSDPDIMKTIKGEFGPDELKAFGAGK